MRSAKTNKKLTGGNRQKRNAALKAALLIFVFVSIAAISATIHSAEIYIDRTGQRQLNFLTLTDGTMNDLRNDPVPDFNWYVSRWDAKNPLQWTHIWSLAQPSDGNIPLDADDVFVGAIAAELFPVIWDIDYPVSTEDDRVYWDKVPYGGPTGGAFDPAANAAAIYVARVEGNNSFWGAKRLSLNPALIPQNQLQYFWLQIDNDPLMPNWFTSIDYSDLAIIFNPGNLAISKAASVVSGFNPPRAGYTTVYRVRVDISNPTITSTGGPMYDVQVTDKFPAGSSIVTPPALGAASIDAAGNLVWNAGILQDGALNAPPAAGSKDFLEVLVSLTPTEAQVGAPVILNAGASIAGGQTPLDPGDGTGNLYPFNFHGSMADKITGVSVVLSTANVVPANTGTISTTASIFPGASISVTVNDSDINLNPAVAETIPITLTNTGTGETETITCVETGPNTGVFTALLPTAFGAFAGANNNGTMNAQAGSTVRALYNDAVAPGGLPATVTADTTILGGTTAAITSTTPILPSNTVTITLNDADLNTDATSIQSLQLTTTNPRTGETETLTYTETGAATGIFTATLSTAYNNAAGANNDGSVNCVSGDTLGTTYNDAVTLNGGSASITANTAVIDNTNSVTIISPRGNYASVTHNVTGTTDPFSSLTMSDPITSAILTTNADAAGNYTFAVVTFPQGITAYTVTSIDPAGNSAIDAATVLIDTLNSVAITGPVPNSVINSQSSNITGTTDPGSTVTLIEPGTGATLTTTADASGNFTFTAVQFSPGANVIAVTSQDPLGNIANTNLAFTVDPSIILSVSSIIPGDTYNTSSITVAGMTDPFATVTTTNPATGLPVTIVADVNGNYNFGSFNFPDGQNTITVNAADQAGNSAATNVTFSVDTTNTNNITTAGLYTTAAINITGTTDPFSSVTMQHPLSGLVFTAVANAAGVYTFPNVFFPDGAYTITTTSTDSEGNAAADTSAITVDSTIALTVMLPADRSVIDTNTINMTGATDPFSTVTMTDPATDAQFTTVADAQGNFAFNGVHLNVGENTVQFLSVDPSGNSATHDHTLIYNPDITLHIVAPENGDIVRNNSQTVSGTTTPGSTVTTRDPATGVVLTVIADIAGNFTFGAINFQDGSNTITVASTAPNGKSTTTSNTFIVADTGVDGVLSVSERAVFGHPIYLEVRDPETYLSATKIDTLTVKVANPANGDSETRTLIETSANSGVFTGLIDTVESAGSDGVNTGKLAVLYGQTVTTTYVDAIRANGALDAQITADTLITNDEIKIQVNITDISGNTTIQPLSNAQIAIIAHDGNGSLTGAVFNYTTNSNGDVPAEFVGRMKTGVKYLVLLNETFNGYPYSHSREFTIGDILGVAPDARGVRTFIVTLDPAGYVYDAVTGARIPGADVTLYHASGAPVAGPFSIYTNNPGATQTNPQLSGDSGVGGGFEFIGSGAASDLTAGYYYITASFLTTPALAATYSPVGFSPASWAGVKEPYTGQLFLVDLQNQPISMRIPLIPKNLPTPFSIDKKANKPQVAPGDVITYTVSVRNLGAASTDPDNPVTVKDTLPPGLTYLKGSAVTSAGAQVAVTQSGQDVFFTLGILKPAADPLGGDNSVILYQAVLDSSAQPGIYVTNTAVAMINLFTLSNKASAVVKVISDPLLDEATLIGKVFVDENGNGVIDKGEKGLKGVGVLLDDGTYVVTGEDGKYSVPGARPGPPPFGSRAVKIEKRSLPPGVILTTPAALFVTLTPGGMDKANFGVKFTYTEPKDTVFDYLSLFTFDTAIGDLKSSTPGNLRTDGDSLPDGTHAHSRLAFFLTGVYSQDYTVTTAYDTYKRHTNDIFTDKNKDYYYPVYGDDSRASYLADTQGRFYLKIKSLSSDLVVGNYKMSFDGTALAAISRSLYGAYYKLDKKAHQERNGPRTIATAFASGHKQMQARNEFRSTGGSRYSLAHSYIVPGSEIIKIEVRDSFAPERVVYSRALSKDTDYEIDYQSGRIRLFEPAASSAGSDYLNRSDIESGDPVWIVSEYLYSPNEKGYGTFGARLQRITSGGVGIGATYITENIDSRDHKLHGVDFSWKPDPGGEELCRVEWARSESGGMSSLISIDGGSSFTTIGAPGARSGSAYKVDFKITAIKNLDWQNYWTYAASGFNGAAFNERGIRRGGVSMKYGNSSDTWKLDYTNAVSLSGASDVSKLRAGGSSTSAFRLAFKRALKRASAEAEFIHRRNASEAFGGLNPGTSDSIALRFEREMNERIKLAFTQQITVSPKDEHQSTLGVKYKMGKKNTFDTEVSFGTNGGGGRAGFERSAADGSKTYINSSTGYSSEFGGDVSNTTAGYSSAISKDTNAYAEYSAIERSGETAARNTLGLNHRYRLGEGSDISFSLERSREHSSLQGSYFTNTFNLSAQHITPKQIRIGAESEFGLQSGSVSKSRFSFRFLAEGKPREPVHISTEYEYNVTDNRRTQKSENKYTKLVLGMAWRPAHSDKLNFLSKIGRVREYRSASLNVSMLPDTVSKVYSLEGIYDFKKHFSLNEKIASKIILERILPLPDARTRTTLWINGLTWRPSKMFDLKLEYRTRHQPSQLNNRNGIAIESGYTIKQKVRVGAGYNFSSYSDNEFATDSQTYKGVFFRLQGKF